MFVHQKHTPEEIVGKLSSTFIIIPRHFHHLTAQKKFTLLAINVAETALRNLSNEFEVPHTKHFHFIISPKK